MSEDISKKVTEIGPGPSAIRFREPGGSFELMGYLLVVMDQPQEVYQSYFVMRAGVQPPISLEHVGCELCFERIDAEHESPEAFYEWVIEEGAFGEEVDTYSAEETYQSWQV